MKYLILQSPLIALEEESGYSGGDYTGNDEKIAY